VGQGKYRWGKSNIGGARQIIGGKHHVFGVARQTIGGAFSTLMGLMLYLSECHITNKASDK
jgi:hypothetical protein